MKCQVRHTTTLLRPLWRGRWIRCEVADYAPLAKILTDSLADSITLRHGSEISEYRNV